MKNKIFLSQEDSGGGSIHWEISDGSDFVWEQGGNLSIRDCSRQINLEFPTYDTIKFNRSLSKIETFIAELVHFKEQLIADHNKRKRRYF